MTASPVASAFCAEAAEPFARPPSHESVRDGFFVLCGHPGCAIVVGPSVPERKWCSRHNASWKRGE